MRGVKLKELYLSNIRTDFHGGIPEILPLFEALKSDNEVEILDITVNSICNGNGFAYTNTVKSLLNSEIKLKKLLVTAHNDYDLGLFKTFGPMVTVDHCFHCIQY